jgi:hypothetical protein
LLLNPNGVPKILIFFRKKKMLGFRCWSKFNEICKNTHA